MGVYRFQHPERTGGNAEFIGYTETEALHSLQSEYDLDLEEIFSLVLEGNVWEEK